ncbi:hypothetical protein G3A_10835 [Bacillus sp. 17376]|uniref:Uncharacterized protein n=1 Tax=Mesobacillus boroniphilus JCM 21738 TaxID=1294265 RepID=W4RTG2_9BACI|nr:hypothetical protein G3A_10835 [Bacillus sp. 17376]GAE46909.1 hypothetical protein JCM21738_3839 [Mesobacillus boroniphilus JCM 21738]
MHGRLLIKQLVDIFKNVVDIFVNVVDLSEKVVDIIKLSNSFGPSTSSLASKKTKKHGRGRVLITFL